MNKLSNPTVSIITTSYNHEPFISKCINSVLDQTFKNWEQIIIDDASEDNTYKIALAFAKKDKRIRIVRHTRNLGIEKLSDNYNQALKLAHGKYIAILESDDYWPKDKLEKQIRSFDNDSVVMSYGDCVLVNKSGSPIRLFTYNNESGLQDNRPVGSILKLFCKLRFFIIPVTVMIRRSTLVKIGGFRKDNDYPFVDIPTFLRLTIEGEFRFVDEVLGYYRKQGNSWWYRFASKTVSMGRDEVRCCIDNFIKTHKNNKKIVNLKIRKSQLNQKQIRYLKARSLLKPFSLIFNKLSFMGAASPMVAVYLFEFSVYKLRKLFVVVK